MSIHRTLRNIFLGHSDEEALLFALVHRLKGHNLKYMISGSSEGPMMTVFCMNDDCKPVVGDSLNVGNLPSRQFSIPKIILEAMHPSNLKRIYGKLF